LAIMAGANSMGRTRTALLDGARSVVRAGGTRISMSRVAAAAGVAKATLYNHFRTRDAVLAALLADEVESLIERFAQAPLADALAGAAEAVSVHPLRRVLADTEPATLAALARIDPAAPLWQHVQAAVDSLLARHGRAGGHTVVRWLASYLITPATPDAIAADLAILIVSLPDLPRTAPVVDVPARPEPIAGWAHG
jgi:AcrR family transcriptional regulator